MVAKEGQPARRRHSEQMLVRYYGYTGWVPGGAVLGVPHGSMLGATWVNNGSYSGLNVSIFWPKSRYILA